MAGILVIFFDRHFFSSRKKLGYQNHFNVLLVFFSRIFLPFFSSIQNIKCFVLSYNYCFLWKWYESYHMIALEQNCFFSFFVSVRVYAAAADSDSGKYFKIIAMHSDISIETKQTLNICFFRITIWCVHLSFGFHSLFSEQQQAWIVSVFCILNVECWWCCWWFLSKQNVKLFF